MINLEKLRKERDLTQVELARAVGVTQSSVSNIENGVRSLSVPMAKKFAKVLGISWTAFFEDGGDAGGSADLAEARGTAGDAGEVRG